MKRRVAVVGVYQTPYKDRYTDVSLEELIFQAASNVLDQSGVAIDEVNNIVIASSDQVDGRAISSMVTSGSSGAYMKDLLNLSSSSEHAFLLSTMQIMSGVYDLSLVLSWSKCSEGPMEEIERIECEPYFTRNIGMNNILSYSLQASAYLNKYNPSPELINEITIKNRKNALRNRLSHRKSELDIDQVMSSPVVTWPLRSEEIPPMSDGVCAFLLASEQKAEQLNLPKAWINGIGWAADTNWIGERDLTTISSLKVAAEEAYKMAGIQDPLQEIDIAELHECTPYHEAIQYEALGLCEAGESQYVIQQKVTQPDGIMPVNLSGGALSSNPIFCTGLVRIAEAASQVMGQAGEHQAQNVQLALATASSGFASQNNTVVILSNS